MAQRTGRWLIDVGSSVQDLIEWPYTGEAVEGIIGAVSNRLNGKNPHHPKCLAPWGHTTSVVCDRFV